jgi:hypothetical protein
MGKIIQIPIKPIPISEQIKEPNNSLLLDKWTFTCPHCFCKSYFHAEEIIFRKIEFYCKKCGTLHRVTNPAFVLQPKK